MISATYNGGRATGSELKFYAPGVGPLLSMHTDSPGGRAAPISYTQGS